jgi:hypothetical protein
MDYIKKLKDSFEKIESACGDVMPIMILYRSGKIEKELIPEAQKHILMNTAFLATSSAVNDMHLLALIEEQSALIKKQADQIESQRDRIDSLFLRLQENPNA